MIRILIFLSLFLCMMSPVEAAQTQQEKIEWKVLKNASGFEFKYPARWRLKFNEAEANYGKTIYDGDAINATDPNQEKASRLLGLDVQTIGFDSVAEATNEKARLTKSSRVSRQVILVKESTERSRPVLYTVEYLENGALRWNKRIVCGSRMIWGVTGTVGAAPRPLVDKVKKGDLALPYPMSEILASLRCLK